MRDEYVTLMTFGDGVRPMFSELFGLMTGVAEAWAAQGATPEELDLSAFDWDYVSWVDCGGCAGAWGGPPPRVVEEREEYVIERDPLGRTLKRFKRVSSLPLPLDHPVHDMDSWLRIKPLFTFDPGRVDEAALEEARRLRSRGALVVAFLPGGFDTLRALMGTEGACLALVDRPELTADILDTLAGTALRVFERVLDRLPVDQLSVHEDFAGKTGPLLGPAHFRRWLAPYYRAVWDLFRSRGARLFDVDTDGDVNPLVEPMVEAGVNVLHPLEPAAGMDPAALRRRWGRRLALKGGIDKYVLLRGKETIRKELACKMQPMLREGGGMVFGLDHRVPNGTLLEDYRYYVRLGREILGLPPLDGRRRGWGRMAF